MSKKPKKPKQSEAEKASASVAMAEYADWKNKYLPLVLNMKKMAQDRDDRNLLRGRAAADTSQALAGDSSFFNAIEIDQGRYGQALASQLQKADAASKSVSNELGSGVLSAGRQLGFNAQRGLAQAANQQTSVALTELAAEQREGAAKLQAGVNIAGATIMGYADKKRRDRERQEAAIQEGKYTSSYAGPFKPELQPGFTILGSGNN